MSRFDTYYLYHIAHRNSWMKRARWERSHARDLEADGRHALAAFAWREVRNRIRLARLHNHIALAERRKRKEIA